MIKALINTFIICTASAHAAAEDIEIMNGLGSPAEFNQAVIDTCAADYITEHELEDAPTVLSFPNDTYGLKRIHFALVVMDVNEDGLVDSQEVENYNPREVGFWNKFDLDRDGNIEGTEVKRYIENQLEATWRNSFRSMDRDRNGEISERDLLRVYSSNLDQINIESTIRKYDENSDGVISIEEYLEASRAIVRSQDLKN